MGLKQERVKAWLAILLLAITTVAVFLQWQGLYKKKVYDQHSDAVYHALDDRVSGGKSVASLEITDKGLILHCKLVREKFPWPYCQLAFSLSIDGKNGVDFTEYSHVNLWVRYEDHDDLGIRFQLHNFDPEYSKFGVDSTNKFNVAEFFPEFESYPVKVPLTSLNVPIWWLGENKLPLRKVSTEYNNVKDISLTTASIMPEGEYTLHIEKIEFVGKYISDKNLYLFLLFLWGTAGVSYIVSQGISIKRDLNASRRRQKELETLNRGLNLQSKELQEKLIRDPLTGALNRHGIQDIFEQEDLVNGRQTLSIIFIDIDHFKKINDTYGHNIGDDVLVQFAKTIDNKTRDSDLLVRWGGEEFVLACINTDILFAEILAEKLRKELAASTWPENIKLTASFGVAQMREESVTEFLERADAALYSAKTNGRNKVVVAE